MLEEFKILNKESQKKVIRNCREEINKRIISHYRKTLANDMKDLEDFLGLGSVYNIEISKVGVYVPVDMEVLRDLEPKLWSGKDFTTWLEWIKHDVLNQKVPFSDMIKDAAYTHQYDYTLAGFVISVASSISVHYSNLMVTALTDDDYLIEQDFISESYLEDVIADAMKNGFFSK